MTSPQARHWRSAADALAAMRRERPVTRPELGERLGLASGPTSDLVKRMASAALVSERAVAPTGRGRPTTTLHAHPAGPVAVTLDLRHGDWRLGTCAADGTITVVATGPHDGEPDTVLSQLRSRIRALVRNLSGRAVGVGIAVPGATAGNRLVHATLLGWRDIDMARVAPRDVAVVVGNDATMAAVAEARLHSARTLLHLVVEIGVGGAFVVDGRPAASAHGLHGEFGHLPFGAAGAQCPCGARGCWTVAFDVPQVARNTRRRAKPDRRAWLHELFTDPHPTPELRRTRTGLAGDLGLGAAGLVNALDPELVTLGGLAPVLLDSAPAQFRRSFDAGLMTVHRERPPTIVTATASDDAPLIGAGLSVLDVVLDAEFLARWATAGRSGA